MFANYKIPLVMIVLILFQLFHIISSNKRNYFFFAVKLLILIEFIFLIAFIVLNYCGVVINPYFYYFIFFLAGVEAFFWRLGWLFFDWW